MESTRSSDSPVHSAADLDAIYSVRFQNQETYRRKVWSVLARYFSRWIPSDATVLDLGCGYCEFINQAQCAAKYAMDLNPEVAKASLGRRARTRTGLFFALVCPSRQLNHGVYQQFPGTFTYKSACRGNVAARTPCPSIRGLFNRHGTEYQVRSGRVLGFL